MINELFKEALAEIIWSDEIDKVAKATKRAGEIKAYASSVKGICQDNRKNIHKIPILVLTRQIPTELLWEDILVHMIELEGKE